MNKPLKCVLRLHAWVTKYNDEGGDYQVCSRCDAYREKLHLTDRPGPG